MADDFTQFSLEIDRGNTAFLDFVIAVNGVPINITGYLFRFTGKTRVSDLDGQAVISKSSLTPNQCVITNALAGLMTVWIMPADTRSLPAVRQRLYCDLQATDPAGNVFTSEKGTVTIRPTTSQTSP